MKLKNNSPEFIVRHNGYDFTVPSGDFEVASDELGQHIIHTASVWNLNKTEDRSFDVEITGDTVIESIAAITPKITPTKEPIEEVTEEEVVEEIKEEPKPKSKKKK